MTPDEIKKALECCVNQHTSCRECPLHYFSASCIIDLKTQALDYINELEVENSKHIKAIDELTEINIGHEEAVRKAKQACLLCHKRQKKRIKELESEVESITGKFDCQQQVYADLSKIIKTQKTEIDGLKSRNINNCRHWQKKYSSLRDDIIKEFARKLKCGVPQETGVIRCKDVDNLVSEMVGKSNV